MKLKLIAERRPSEIERIQPNRSRNLEGYKGFYNGRAIRSRYVDLPSNGIPDHILARDARYRSTARGA